MRKAAIVMAFTVASALSLGTPTAWAFTCPVLYEQCRQAIKQSKADDTVKQQVSQMCEEGIKLHNDGKHKESVDKLNEALRRLGKR
ncbi:MAG: hypothetical protein C3F12_01645 [Candidatus Methylomirabilota bacterium]|nr:hypothetical protein [Candidatus Methylomirabilis sp.]PWB48493.1 MAG: hypothetical protein C3F12_01645 [candidate division NC10 bacterium]